MVHAGKSWRKTNGINACAPAQQTKLLIISCRPIEFSLSFCFVLLVSIAEISFSNIKLSALVDIPLQEHPCCH